MLTPRDEHVEMKDLDVHISTQVFDNQDRASADAICSSIFEGIEKACYQEQRVDWWHPSSHSVQ